MNDEIKKHMDVLYAELRSWPDDRFAEGPYKENLLPILRNFEKIEEGCYEDFFKEIMDAGGEIFNPLVQMTVILAYQLSNPKIIESFNFMGKIYHELKTIKID